MPKLTLVNISERDSDRIKPVLRWIGDRAPYVGYRRSAKNVLRELAGRQFRDSGWTQIGLLPADAALLKDCLDKYPAGTSPYEQLKMEGL